MSAPLDITSLSLENVAEALGHIPQPICSKCGGELMWIVETSYAHPWGSGYDILTCHECDAVETRVWVGF